MPDYEVQDAKGRKIRMSGDKPPTEAEIDDAFAHAFPETTTQTQTSQTQQGQPGFLSRAAESLHGVIAPFTQMPPDPRVYNPAAAAQWSETIHHPLKTAARAIGVNPDSFMQDWASSNVPAMLGDVVVPGVTLAAYPAVKAALKARAANTPEPGAGRLSVDLVKATPPTKSTPYSPLDVQRAAPYLASEHANAPITTVEALRDAADSAITQVEEHVHQYIAANPLDTIRTDPLTAAKDVLSTRPRTSDLPIGMKELSDLGLDKPMTLADADAVRLQLNAENQAILRRNNYEVSIARKVDPGFAAREAAAASLRDGIYTQLEERGIEGVRALRQDEGSLLKLRDAAQNQLYNAEKPVSGTGSNTMRAKITRVAIPAVGAAVGAEYAGPGGAATGGLLGNELARRLAPPNLTRDALVERAFQNVKGTGVSFPAVPPPSPVAGLLPSHPIELPGIPARMQSQMQTPTAARGLVVRDPTTGRFKRVYTSEGVQ